MLKEYLLKGYSINNEQAKRQQQQLTDLKETVSLLSNILESKVLNTDEATGQLRVVTDYAYALDILDKYNHQQKLLHQDYNIQFLFLPFYFLLFELLPFLQQLLLDPILLPCICY
ncbi:hypothetical protein N824_02515 [Pedobacter sp. V48]|nr:hypothetical protein N824_02515 [Pedobacter sp. V48]